MRLAPLQLGLLASLEGSSSRGDTICEDNASILTQLQHRDKLINRDKPSNSANRPFLNEDGTQVPPWSGSLCHSLS